MTKVICNHVEKFDACATCEHGQPHVPCWDGDPCTLWDRCGGNTGEANLEVRCVPVGEDGKPAIRVCPACGQEIAP